MAGNIRDTYTIPTTGKLGHVPQNVFSTSSRGSDQHGLLSTTDMMGSENLSITHENANDVYPELGDAADAAAAAMAKKDIEDKRISGFKRYLQGLINKDIAKLKLDELQLIVSTITSNNDLLQNPEINPLWMRLVPIFTEKGMINGGKKKRKSKKRKSRKSKKRRRKSMRR
jgi:hypothetical protein